MYEYTYYRLPEQRGSSLTGTTRIEAHLDLCHHAIEQHAREGWRFVTDLKPYGGHTTSELVFERVVGEKE